MRKALLVGLASLLTALAAVAPVAADTSLRDVGTVGGHRLIDTIERPGMICEMTQQSSGYWIMDGISVRPPVMRGTRNGQRVAWRFIVERSGVGPFDWQLFYRSPRQLGTADVHSPAAFRRMSVDVSGTGFYLFRVRIKMFWYGADGAVVGRAVHAVDYYREGATGNVYSAPCAYDTSEPT